MLDEKLLTKEYYMSKLSMFMQQSFGIEEQVENASKFISDLDTACDTIGLIHNLDHIEELIKNDTIKKEEYVSEPLETLADIMNIKRNVNIKIPNDDETITIETLKLNNLELFLYIKFSILKSNFNGTRKSLNELYNSALPTIDNVSVLMLTDEHSPLTCNIWLNTNTEYIKYMDNFIKLFLYSDLFIESLGIKYNKNTINDLDSLLILCEDKLTSSVVNWQKLIKKAILYPEKVAIEKPSDTLPTYYFKTSNSIPLDGEEKYFYFKSTKWYDKSGKEISEVSQLTNGNTYYLDWEMMEDDDTPTLYTIYPSSNNNEEEKNNVIYITSNIQRLG